MVPEQRTKTVEYTVQKPVWETVTDEYTVQVPEWSTVDQQYTVTVPVWSTVDQEYTVQVPEYSGGLHVVNRSFVKTAHGRNMKVCVWTVNEPEDMRRMLNLGVDGIVTDFPGRLAAWVRAGGR